MADTLLLLFKRRVYPITLWLRAFRQRRLNKVTSRATESVVKLISLRDPPVRKHMFYGAIAISPINLVTWYLFETDVEFERAKSNGLTQEIDALTRRELGAFGYPKYGISRMHVAFASIEDIDRKSGGNLYLYFNS